MNEILFIFIVFFGLVAIGMPIAFALGGASILTLALYGYPVGLVAGRTINAMDRWIWLAIPLFIYLGTLMNEGGVTEKLIDFSDKILGHIAGGLSHVNVAVSMLLAGMSGSTLADAAGVGKLLIPNMKKAGYSGGYAAAMTAISATIGSIIPPSINFIIVGTVGDISILRMWLGGIIPGIIIGLFLMFAGYFICKRRRYTLPRKRSPMREVRRSTFFAVPALVVPIIILGGMRLGIFTPTEAAAAGVIYIGLTGFFVYRQLTMPRLLEATWDTAKMSGNILWLIAMGALFATVLHLSHVGEVATQVIMAITQSKVVFMLGAIFVLILLGCVMEVSPIIFVMLPLTLPVAKAFGFDPVHFGVVFGFITVVGQSTPPVGLTLYITTGIAKCSVEEYVREGWILWVPMVAAILLFAFCPQLVLWLPNLIMRAPVG